MTSFTKLACAFLLAGGLGAPAYAAQTGDTTSGGSAQTATTDQNTMSGQGAAGAQSPTGGQNAAANSQMNNPNAMHIGQRLRADLSKAGFTDITLMPMSFLVRAKDSQGNPVMMVINPDSIAAVTTKGGGNSGSNANSGSASSGTHNMNNSGGESTGSGGQNQNP